MNTKQKKIVAMSVPRKLAMLQLAFDYSIGVIDKSLFRKECNRMHLDSAENDYLTDLLFQML